MSAEFDFREISRLYRKMESEERLSSDEEGRVALFEKDHPLLRSYLLLDYETLYDRVSRAPDADLTTQMLHFLLLHYFEVDLKKGKKADLLNELKKNIYNDGYNSGYMGGMSVTEDGAAHPNR